MSWGSQFFHDLADGFLGKPPSQLPTSGTPIHDALIAVDTAVNQASATTRQAAESAVDAYLTTKVGPVGTTMIDNALQALIQAAEAKLSPAGLAHGAQTDLKPQS